jgi:hypothetical protein
MPATRQALQKFQNWMRVLKEEGYGSEDRQWFADFWWERHDDEGNLYPHGVRRSHMNRDGDKDE